MYGLLLENIAAFVKLQWGEGKWESVRRKAGIDAPSFSIHHVYAETLMSRLSRTAIQVLGVEEREFFESMGVYFVEFVGQYGYDKVLTVLGRHLRDFLNGLDNLHEYLKFSYPKMRAPSFFCDNETENGLQLHYRSKRRGFVYYTMGQIRQTKSRMAFMTATTMVDLLKIMSMNDYDNTKVAKHFYDQECKIDILSEELDGDTMHVIYHLTFNNQAFVDAQNMLSMIRREQQLPIRASLIFELFPFSVAFVPSMEITYTGHALLTIIKDLVGQCMTEAFDLTRPLIPFCFQTIIERSNNIFELVTVAPIKDDEALKGSLDLDEEDEEGVGLRLRGQMLFMEEWNMLLYLAMPVMPDIDCLVESGLFINDLALHDCSRDLVLAGTQQSVELRLALDQEQQKSRKLEDSMKKLDEEMRRTDELLYQMIPKQVADRIRRGENPVDTCEVFEAVSVLFSDVVTFTDICSRITPMQVVGMLNHMYSLFDQLTERNGVYKVETIGDAYMVVSGAPTVDGHHADRICDMALDMIDASQAIKDPSKGEDQEHLKLRVGCHSGMVVAGVVGIKMPRYCLFGDTVNTASRMESTGIGGQIQISESTRNLIPSIYKVEKRGTVTVKGKGEMNTFWLHERENRVDLKSLTCNSFVWTAPTVCTEIVMGGSKPPEVPVSETTDGDKIAAATTIVKDTKVETPSNSVKSSKTTPPPTTVRKSGSSETFLLKRQNSVDKINLDSLRKAVGKTNVLNTIAAPLKAMQNGSPINTPTVIEEPVESTSRPVTSGMKFSNTKLIMPDASSPGRSRSNSISQTTLVVPTSGMASPVNSLPPSPSILAGLKVPKVGITYNSSPGPRRPSVVSDSTIATPSNAANSSSEEKPPSTPVRRPLSSPRNRVQKALLASPSRLRALQNEEAENANIVVTITSNVNDSSKPFQEGNPTLPTVQNQTQENFLITKATLNNTSNMNGNPSNDIKNDVNPNGRRVPLINRLRQNKVALLTSEAMAQMGCSGFRARPKEVVSQSCNLL